MKTYLIRYCFNSVTTERFQCGYTPEDAVRRLCLFLPVGVDPDIRSVEEVFV